VILVVIVLSPASAFALDYGTLVVETMHAVNREPIGPSTVRVEQGEYISTKTARPGQYQFRLENVLAGPQIEIEVSCPGFETVTGTEIIARDRVTTINMYLRPDKRAQLSTEQEDYAVGETVVLRVRNPGPGSLDTTEVEYEIYRLRSSGEETKIYERTLHNPTERFDDPLDEGESGYFAWHQRNQRGNQVSPGNFRIKVMIPVDKVAVTTEIRVR